MATSLSLAMNDSLLNYGLLLACALLVWQIAYQRSSTRQLSMIPTIGPSGMVSSYIGAMRTLLNYNKVIETGYAKYRGGMFKIPVMNNWMVVISGPELLSEYSRAREQDLSMGSATSKALQGPHTLGMGKNGWPGDEGFHRNVVRHAMTKNLSGKFPEVMDEIVVAFSDTVAEYAKVDGDDWAEIPTLRTMADLVSRVSNRYFLNADICRNKEFMDVSVNYTIQAFIAGQLINMFPSFLQPLVGPLVSPFKSTMKKAGKYLGPMVKERLEKERQYGRDYPGRPNDIVSWLMDAAPEHLRTPEGITHRVLIVHLASIHTSSNTLTHALYQLASMPEYIAPLREEIEQVSERIGWTKEGIDNMHKVDSFMRESQRINGLGSVIMHRRVMKEEGMTFSNGITLPKGTLLAVAERSIHYDRENFIDAEKFDGYRWLQADGTSKEIMTKVGVDCLTFGAGRHSCPGRFFASTELKAMFAHLLDSYDIKLQGGSTERPPNRIFGSIISPNSRAKLLLRKRK